MVDFVKPTQVFLDCSATTTDEALAFLAAKAHELGIATDEGEVLAGLRAREAEGTTGMMAGFAVPHCKSAGVARPAVLVARFAGDVAWETMDGAPIRTAIALMAPADEVETDFMVMLSQVAVLLMREDFRAQVDAASDGETIAAIINDALDG